MEFDVSKCKYYEMARCPEGYSCKYHCCDCYFQQLQQLKAENEELKNQIKGEINATQKWYQEHTNEKFKADKYKNALDEIEEICNDSFCNNTVCANCKYNAIDCDLVRRKAVLQKIKEVEDDR